MKKFTDFEYWDYKESQPWQRSSYSRKFEKKQLHKRDRKWNIDEENY